MNNNIWDRIKKDNRVEEGTLAKRIGRYPFFSMSEGASTARTIIEGKERINFGSNNYLGLTIHPDVIVATHRAVDKYGAGVTGSRLLNGTLDLHRKLEEKLARWYGAEAALVFPTGYSANLGVLSHLLHRHDHVLMDQEAHASIIDGAILSRAKVKKFRHNDLDHLNSLIQKNAYDMCIVEGIYSMKGDMAPVKEIARLCKAKNVLLMVDEAHALGTIGQFGRGASAYCDALQDVDLLTLTFSKSLASCGGAVIGKSQLIESIKISSRPFMFTASNTPGAIASAITALDILQHHPEMLDELQEKTKLFKKELLHLGLPVEQSDSPIITIKLGDDFRVLQAWKILWNRMVFCNPVLTPAVVKGHGLLRFSVSRLHSKEDITTTINACRHLLPLIK